MEAQRTRPRIRIKSVDDEIAELVDVVREAKAHIGEVKEEVNPVIEAAKQRLAMLLEHRGDSWSDNDGYARIVTGGVRTSYDTRALDQLIIDNPEQYGWLREYRKEFPIRGWRDSTLTGSASARTTTRRTPNEYGAIWYTQLSNW